MKKTLLTFSMSLAVLCCTLAYAVNDRGAKMNVVSSTSSTISSSEDIPSYGVSIGTVEGQLYSESGLDLDYFNDVDYVAKTSEGTYMGFDYQQDYYSQMEYLVLVAINSTETAVTIPDYIKVGEKTYPVTEIGGYWSLNNGFNSNIKILTVPSTVNYIYIDYQFDRYLDAMYMLGKAPEINGRNFQVTKVYVCDRSNVASYTDKYGFSYSSIIPYGWDYEWITVNVEKKGEFAETYLTQNDYNWEAALYVKVTGNINDIDLRSIKNLTSLMKLDLSETTVTSLPDEFMYNRTSLVEVKLPSTLKSIGNSAFYGCSALQSFDLNGITDIGSSVFYGCRSLSYINLTGVQRIGNYAFNNCSKLNNIDLSTVTLIGANAFSYCYSLESIDLSSATSIGSYSFQNTAIQNVVLPESLTELASYVFQNCENLVSVEIPSSILTIYPEAFRNCTSLTSVRMETGLTTIESSVFEGCTSLEEITIPATVKSIGSNAFRNTAIKNFKCYAVVPPIATSSFIGGNMDMTRTFLYVPPFSKDFYRNTQYWSDFHLMRSIEDQIDYIFVDRPLTINLEEEDNYVVANNPEIVLSIGNTYDQWGDLYGTTIGQLTATGTGTLSAGHLTVTAVLDNRSTRYYQYCPTLINYADKMRADDITVNMSFYDDYYYGNSGSWHFISLPYDVKVSDIVPSNNTYWVIRRYDSAARAAGDTSSTWVNLTDNDVMEAGKGYIVSTYSGDNEFLPTLSFKSGNSVTKNNLFRPTDIIVPLTEYSAEFAHNRSWNLVGNPYPCYFDMHYLNEEFTAPITVWNGNSYVAYSPIDDDLVLAPYEAFFVQCPLDATEMTFKEGGRMHSNEGLNLYKSPAVNPVIVSVDERNVFNFEISNEHFSDRTRIVINEDASLNYEIGRDASKFFADNDNCAQIYVVSDVNYSISERPVNDGSATIGIRAPKEDTYTLSLTGRYSPEWQVILTDNVTGSSLDLTEKDYMFTTSADDSHNRFSVKFMLNNQSGIESVITEFGENSEVTVTALNGAIVYSGRMSEIKVPSAGIYTVSNGQKTLKAILK